MNNRFERTLMIGILILVVALTVYSLVAQIGKDAYRAGVSERATVEVRASAVAATLTAVK
jgi:hypothetical protein